MKITQIKHYNTDANSLGAINDDTEVPHLQARAGVSANIKGAMQLDNSKLDRLGVWITSMCAFHCMALPFLIPFMPLIASSFVASAWFERTILSFSILVGFAALFIGFKQYHRQLYPLYSLTLGGLIYWNKHMFGEAYEPLTIGLGAVFIIGAHLANLRLCKKCKSCETC